MTFLPVEGTLWFCLYLFVSAIIPDDNCFPDAMSSTDTKHFIEQCPSQADILCVHNSIHIPAHWLMFHIFYVYVGRQIQSTEHRFTHLCLKCDGPQATPLKIIHLYPPHQDQFCSHNCKLLVRPFAALTRHQIMSGVYIQNQSKTRKAEDESGFTSN